jgi:hypothetical protein
MTVLIAMLALLVIVSSVVNAHRAGLAQNSSQSNQPSESSLVQEYLDGMQRLRGADLTPEARAQLQSAMAQKRAQLRGLRKQVRLANGILPFGPGKSGGAKKTATTTTADDSQKLQSAQKCTACKYVWKQIEMDVGGSKSIQAVQASFQKNCMNAQKASIYYATCEDMYDDLYAMTEDYMSSNFDELVLCQKAGFCP